MCSVSEFLSNPKIIVCDYSPELADDGLGMYLHPWKPNLIKFIREKAMTWAKQKCNAKQPLVIHNLDLMSTQTQSSIQDLIDGGFPNPIIMYVSSLQKVNSSLRSRCSMEYSMNPNMYEILKENGWILETPPKEDLNSWKRILES
jgi:hypothetical protein